MTVIDMVGEFSLMIETVSDVFMEEERPLTYDVERWLNSAQDRFIVQRYTGGSFAETTAIVNARKDELRSLTVTHEFINPVTASTYEDNVYYVDPSFPDDLLYFFALLDAKVKVTRTNNPVITVAEYVPTVITTEAGISQFYTTTFNVPIIRNPLLVIDPEELTPAFKILTDSYTTPTSVLINYVKKPRLMAQLPTDSDTQTSVCELSYEHHKAIVELAVSMFIDDYKTRLIPKSKSKEG